MSAAANAAGYLYASGRLRGAQAREEKRARELLSGRQQGKSAQAEAERAAEDLRRQRAARQAKPGGKR